MDHGRTALIGYTGFVGGNLDRAYDWGDRFNSANIGDIAGREYDLLVCAGAKAEKWRINADPDADAVHLAQLLASLRSARAAKVVLISTVDVYPRPVEVDENTEIDTTGQAAYGRHRLQLEADVAASFDTTVLRLPALYGPGLKKNVIYDFLHDNQIEKINTAGSFQFYNLGRLFSDLETALANNFALVNFAVEPVRVSDILRTAFGSDFVNEPEGATPGRYDFRSVHAEAFGGSGGYLENRDEVLAGITDYVKSERG